MRIRALHDRHGRILAAVHLTPNYNGPLPVADEETQLVDLDVPDTHASLDFVSICTQLHVRDGRLVPIAASD